MNHRRESTVGALRRAKGEEGFTLIELLIVIVILGILAAVVVFAVGGITGRGTTNACKADWSTVNTAVEAYKADNGSYPTAFAQLTAAASPYVKSQPSQAAYKIDIAAGGVVNVMKPADTPTATAAAATGCP
jgi:type II secretion system protein G